MKCENCIWLLDEYIGHELAESEAAAVAVHLANCADCADCCQQLRAEQAAYRQYFAAVTAQPDLWARVESGIEKSPGRNRQKYRELRDVVADLLFPPFFKPALPVSLLLLFILSGVFVIFIRKDDSNAVFVTDKAVLPGKTASPGQVFSAEENNNQRTPKPVTEPSAEKNNQREAFSPTAAQRKDALARSARAKRKTPLPPSAVRTPGITMIGEVAAGAEREYLKAIAVLSRDIARKKTNLSLEMNSRYAQLLDPLDRSIGQTRRALRAEPGNPVVIQYMMSAYSKKVELLRAIAGN